MNHADAWVQLNAQGVKVTKLHARVQGLTAEFRWFGFTVDSPVTMSCPGIGSVTTSVVFIPDGFEFVGNAAYQEHVDGVTLAFTHQRPVILYADSCLEGHPRIVGIDILYP